MTHQLFSMQALCEGSLTTTSASHVEFVGEKTTMLNAQSKTLATWRRGVGDDDEPIHRDVRYLWTPGTSLTGHDRWQRTHQSLLDIEGSVSDVARLVDL